MFRRILIANRGEIAQRIIRACRELGIETVAGYSQADADSLQLRMADETICIGPAASAQSYLHIPSIISAAELADVEAIHPGYGFLAENARFAALCEQNGVTFVGPRPATMDRMGLKWPAKVAMRAAGLDLTPGSDGLLNDVEAAVAATTMRPWCAAAADAASSAGWSPGAATSRGASSRKTLVIG